MLNTKPQTNSSTHSVIPIRSEESNKSLFPLHLRFLTSFMSDTLNDIFCFIKWFGMIIFRNSLN